MKVALDDARAVVKLAAAKGKRKVVLGGHSLGASLMTAYASWDFNGRPGYKDVDGMVLIDGGLLGSFDPFTLAEAQARGRHTLRVEPVRRPARRRHPRGRRASSGRSGRSTRCSRRRGRRPTSNPSRFCRRHSTLRSRSRTARCSATPSTATPRPRRSPCSTSTAAARRLRRPARLRARRHHPDRAARRVLRPGAEQRDRVVLPAPAVDRHQRRQRARAERRRELPRPAPVPPEEGRTCRSTRSRPTSPRAGC